MLAIAAVIAMGIVMAALPRTVARRDRLLRLNGEIVEYQRAIRERQEQVKSIQFEILSSSGRNPAKAAGAMIVRKGDASLDISYDREMAAGILCAVMVLALGVGFGIWRMETKDLSQATISMEEHRLLLQSLDLVWQENQRVLMQNRAALEALAHRR
jgi:predicted regulator of Ras-like GTPase activity (Roadblock/LC7/MglB family)